ncbi:uncharacterized protein UV8b_00294 [Ustilaginoidea virens]|uniref:Uncharacterized protein n=1 Tax=Ustilaginoidea virens TaxID=1159556 RepID=A0A8E5MDE6_USTVR|nr:uncharacterized protein UV8b_00294 [Ustilaginoidea virens]QUC16053.1 hypothetical protein UV8b_00294 [Ustilaginoidea virens]
MTQSSWAQQATDRFFGGRKSPSQMQCAEIAQSVCGASTVRPVDSPGSMSYTVICSGRPEPQQDLISTCHGDVEEADPPLSIYSIPYLRGSSCTEVLAFQVEMDPEEEAKHGVFVKHLARQLPHKPDIYSEAILLIFFKGSVKDILARLAEESPWSILSNSMLSRLIEYLPLLFSQDYPQVLTHGDFLVTNILVDENKFEIRYRRLVSGGGEEFWAVSGVEGEERRGRTQGQAEAAGRIGAILRLAFRRNADGSPSEEVLASERRTKQLRAWVGEQAARLA